MEILDNLQNEIRALRSEIQQIKQQFAKPPVVNVDTAKLATELTQHFADHRRAMEDIAKRIEAVTASIPRSVTTTWRIEPTTKQFMAVVLVLAVVFSVLTYMVLSSGVEQSSREQRQMLVRANAVQGDELNYLRRKNPRDAAQYARENR